MGEPRTLGFTIPDEDVFLAESAHSGNGCRIMRTIPFNDGQVVYLDARDAGFLLAARQVQVQIVMFWMQIAQAMLLYRMRQIVEGEHSKMADTHFIDYIEAEWWDDADCNR